MKMSGYIYVPAALTLPGKSPYTRWIWGCVGARTNLDATAPLTQRVATPNAQVNIT